MGKGVFFMCHISVSLTKGDLCSHHDAFELTCVYFFFFFVRKHVTAATEAWLCLLLSEKPSFKSNDTNVKLIKNHHDRRVTPVVTRDNGAAQSGRLFDIPLLSGMSSVLFTIY